MTEKAKKQRLDEVLVEHNFFETKSKAQAAIMAGDVKIDDKVITKAGFQIAFSSKLNIEIKTMPYVSRGGFKLEKALKEFNINLKDRICLDSGASTGGFTDCMLQNGAKKVYAVDVGYNQLAWKLIKDKRVKNIEKTNIKNVEFNAIYGENEPVADFCAMDVSFISITKILNNLKKLLKENFEIVTLIKPQFEAGKEDVGNGVIKEEKIHVKILSDLIEFFKENEFRLLGLTYSPIKGPKGNIEYLAHLKSSGINIKPDIHVLVKNAFKDLK
ncbi:TlyA family RNA methyltransferase [bacterium]|nr:TlyA family RNA methyltransferase [bacterium]